MLEGLDPIVIGLLVFGVFLAGTVNGTAGFGFSVVGTMLLAIAIDPATAVVFMIIPVLSVNISLVGELSVPELQSCGRRFGFLIVAALLGTVVGMVVLERAPEQPLQILLGLIALAYVVTSQAMVPIPGLGWVKGRCYVESTGVMVAFGAISGAIFGATNVGVQLVAYVRSFSLRHGLFVGVIALIFVGLNAIRVVIAGSLGLYADITILVVSILAAIPALAGVEVGKRLRPHVDPHVREALVLGLLAVIGVRLLLAGVGF